MYKPVDAKPDFPKLEEEVLEYWRKNDIFGKSEKRNEHKPSFVFFEGPPTANGWPGLHHIEARAFKDVILRFQTMLGKYVVRKAGWDTQGLPVEIEVEKSLGISGKKSIENLVPGDRRASIEKFNRLCRENVWKYKDEWEQFTGRMGFWIDLKRPYVTYENSYIESVWWILKQLWEKRLVYRGHKVLPFCPRCGTALSSHEVAQGYRNIEENSVYIKFEAKAKKIEAKDGKGHKVVIKLDHPTYILSWTTTPWTLPGNVALAVGGNIDYSIVVSGKNNYILAASLVEKILGKDATVLETVKGKYLQGLSYRPLFEIEELSNSKSHKVYQAGFVSTEEGTGIVHTAVMYGEDDYNLGTEVGLPKFHTVSEEGKFIDSVHGLAGRYVKDKETEEKILHHLEKNHFLFKRENYSHDYPFCWRCGTPLLYYARDSWFIRMSGLREQLLQNNRQINWVPDYFKEGRFGGWLAEAKDWAISRDRYWGTPLPFWKCDSCGELDCIGSVAELQERAINSQFPIPNFSASAKVSADRQTNSQSQVPKDQKTEANKFQDSSSKFQDFDLHRPYIDEIKLKCGKCGKGEMTRAPEVLDAWFDSGAMPFAQWHYPFENREKIDGGIKDPSAPPPAGGFASASVPSERTSADRQDDDSRLRSERQFPADYISEAVDQTRGWFYTLLAISTALGRGAPYKNVICLGHILDSRGQKMSKSKGNVVLPKDLAEKYGMDIARWYMYSVNQPGEAKLFTEADLVRMQRRVQIILWNVYNYFITYANTSGWEFDSEVSPPEAKESPNLLDQWIKIRLQQLVNSAADNLSAYNVFRASRDIELFIDDFSTWYLRRSRGRVDSNFFASLYRTLIYFVKVLAPFMPFLSEKIYSNLTPSYPTLDKGGNKGGYPESVHLCNWPETRRLEAEEIQILSMMKGVRSAVEAVLAWRKEKGIKVRQPLSEILLVGAEQMEPYLYLLADELNFVNARIVPSLSQSQSGLIELPEIPGLKMKIFVNPELTPELKLKGLARELERQVQDLRKESGLKVGEQVEMFYDTASQEIYDAFAFFDQNKTYVKQIVGMKEKVDFEKQMQADGRQIWLGLKKI